MSTDDGNVGGLGGGTSHGGEESGGSNNVKGSDTEETAFKYQLCSIRYAACIDGPLGVVDTLLLEDLSANGDGRVDGVGNHTNESLGGNLGGGEGEVTNDGGVGLRGKAK